MRGNFLPFQPIPLNADPAVSVLCYIFFGRLCRLRTAYRLQCGVLPRLPLRPILVTS